MGVRRPLVMELYVQQHDDVSTINAESKRRSDRSLQAASAPATPCMFARTRSIAHFTSSHLTSLHFFPPLLSSPLLYFSSMHSQPHPLYHHHLEQNTQSPRKNPNNPIHIYFHPPKILLITLHPKKIEMPPTLEELRFLRTLTPPPRNSSSEFDSDDSYDPYRSPTPENTTGVEFDPEDEVWRCTHCGWEVETVDGVQGYCREGHAVSSWGFLLVFSRLAFLSPPPLSLPSLYLLYYEYLLSFFAVFVFVVV